MGEIGIDSREYLYELKYVDMVLINHGYVQRYHHLWSSVRWQTFYLMTATVGSKGMKEAGVNSPTDLLQFPWEHTANGTDTQTGLPSEADIEQLRQMMREENARINSTNK